MSDFLPWPRYNSSFSTLRPPFISLPWFLKLLFYAFLNPRDPLLFVWQTGDREQEIALLFYEGVRFLGDAGVFGVQQFAHSSGGTMRLKSHVGNGTYKCNTNLKTKASFCNIYRYLILFLFQIVVSTDRNDLECIRNIYLFLSSSQWPTLYPLWHKKGPPSDFVVSWQRSSETKLNCFLNQYSHPPLCIKA